MTFEQWTEDWPKGERVIALAKYHSDTQYKQQIDRALRIFSEVVDEVKIN